MSDTAQWSWRRMARALFVLQTVAVANAQFEVCNMPPTIPGGTDPNSVDVSTCQGAAAYVGTPCQALCAPGYSGLPVLLWCVAPDGLAPYWYGTLPTCEAINGPPQPTTTPTPPPTVFIPTPTTTSTTTESTVGLPTVPPPTIDFPTTSSTDNVELPTGPPPTRNWPEPTSSTTTTSVEPPPPPTPTPPTSSTTTSSPPPPPPTRTPTSTPTQPTPPQPKWPAVQPLRPWANKAWCPQVSGLDDICTDNLLTTSYEPNSIISVDGFNVDASEIAQLKSKGYLVVCYFSGGTLEYDRPDTDSYPSGLIGNKMSGWNEYWFDIRPTNPLHNTLLSLMEKRIDLAASKGCQAIEMDNVDCWQANCIPGEKAGSQGMYSAQLEYNKWLANTVHKYGMAFGLKNDLDQIKDLIDLVDFGINESCNQYNECNYYVPFTRANKAVLGTAYKYSSSSAICRMAADNEWTWLYAKGRNWIACPLSVSGSSSEPGIPGAAADEPLPASTWTEWSACSLPCAGVQYRYCGSPRPLEGGVDCVGNSMQYCNQPGASCPPVPAAFGEDGRNCWNITAPADGNVWPTAVPENEVVRFWCDDGYGRIGYAQYGCYGGQLVGTPTCQYAGLAFGMGRR